MFAYFNYGGFLFVSLLLLLGFLVEKERELLGGALLVMLLLFLYDAYSTYDHVQENKRYFQAGERLICESGGGPYSNGQEYSVSKSEGWQLKKHYFIKNSLMIQPEDCKIN